MPPLRLQTMSPPRTPLKAALRACAGSFGLVFAYSCSYNLLLLAPSIYLLQIYDRVLSSRSGDTLLMLTLIVAFAVVVGGVLDALRRAALGRMGEWLEEELHPAALSASFKYAYEADRVRASEAYRDLTALRQFAQSGACSTLFDALWTPLFLGVLFLVHPLLGAIGALSALFLLGLGLAGDWLTEGPRARSAAALTRSQGWFGMTIGNLHVIRAMGMLDAAARLIGQAAQDARSEQGTVQRRHETIMMISKPARALAQVLIMGAAAWLVLEQSRSPAIIFATSLLFGRALAPIEGAIVGWKAFAMALAACRRLNDILSAVTPVRYVKAVPDRPRGDLIVSNVGAVLPGSSHMFLKDVSFRLAPGECLGIIGPSGSGKSMLGKVITAISAPTAGSILLDGVDISAIRDSGECRRVGYLPQDIDLFGETIKDIIARLDDADLQKVIEAAKLAGIHETIVRLPQGYDTVVVGGGANLPRGLRQRLGLARAFFGDPHLVVLDEPNSSLDALGERMLFDAIEWLKAANITVIIITHRIGILGVTDKIAIMQDGAVTAFGESREVFERCLARAQVASREPVCGRSDQNSEGSLGASPQPISP
ncbi:type I secretion system permease/ATPase [Bradyrhizobium lablabi]|uniref:type I secretion system permease/ATPase n=1 Tax=Bradyrhizobium lablabi TaxID=722472 RepID=UPI001BA5F115|nr:type I secretion system permease/ATPase [Bradyrhizobium lablabi]MBR1121970.1 type I secretion system permease/ATPase [Bradyrhizobium lablabi]